ncbi:Clan CD, family C14, metacaspase-like cysteine peptidase [Tritrichomonas foetus]|uniref:Clan CD, family C14, metacaspase-like cysteine peptidase n=1 Tax=Tritrichomonas foetus TaxID=1144522 RepID=A0A1J4JUY3_9EUKA|nr:Clan CD, family C14, metacaspase-like cysteine peptidase [Tritrichomonas foetus]|eukprot:OHT01332.1 Clan CD, family C14, metacaspase-like cysteine peptidase [Tritrichomonas foetus]
MGQLCSAAKQVVTALVPTLLQQLKLNFTQEEWDSAHNSGTVEENNETLSGLGTNLKTASSLPTNLGKAAFICCNTYTRPDYSLGVGPMNDAITVATAMKEHGFTIYFAHNPTSTEFKKYFKHFIGNTKEYLLVYYTGHGASIDDTHGDEDDEKDEALVFDDAVFVSDDDLAEIIAGAGKPSSSKIVLLSDCCHSGSIYDLDNPHYSGKIPANIMSIAAARDSETAKQTTIGGADQGIFTFYFYKLLEETPTLTPTTMESKINSYIKKYEQCYTVHATTSSLLTTQIFK